MQHQRDITIDIAKGLAIILIVAGHVIRGLSAAGITRGVAWIPKADTAIYLVHLAVFVMLAGLFVARGVEKRGQRNYIVNRAVDFGWLYLVWTLGQGLVKVLTASLVNTPLTLPELFREFVRPTSQMWYLPFLLTFTALATFARAWDWPRLTLALALVVSLARWGNQGSLVGTMGWGLLLFFAVGVLVGYRRLRLFMTRAAFWTAGVVGLVVYVAILTFTNPTVPTEGAAARSPLGVALGLLASSGGVLGLLVIARCVAFVPLVKDLLRFLGERSLEIFLAHIVFASGLRIALSKFGVANVYLHLGVGITTGIIGSLCLWWLAKRLHVDWLFATPQFLARRASTVWPPHPMRPGKHHRLP